MVGCAASKALGDGAIVRSAAVVFGAGEDDDVWQLSEGLRACSARRRSTEGSARRASRSVKLERDGKARTATRRGRLGFVAGSHSSRLCCDDWGTASGAGENPGLRSETWGTQPLELRDRRGFEGEGVFLVEGEGRGGGG